MVEAALFVACANILATMDISPELDGHKKPIMPAVEYTATLVAFVSSSIYLSHDSVNVPL